MVVINRVVEAETVTLHVNRIVPDVGIIVQAIRVLQDVIVNAIILVRIIVQPVVPVALVLICVDIVVQQFVVETVLVGVIEDVVVVVKILLVVTRVLLMVVEVIIVVVVVIIYLVKAIVISLVHLVIVKEDVRRLHVIAHHVYLHVVLRVVTLIVLRDAGLTRYVHFIILLSKIYSN